ncbi:hypothetical protein HMI56_007140 [Coelomomyces lativittatus]|nr:hypothetical protein HMI56_007140 [Coelomomyces lativittatus]
MQPLTNLPPLPPSPLLHATTHVRPLTPLSHSSPSLPLVVSDTDVADDEAIARLLQMEYDEEAKLLEARPGGGGGGGGGPPPPPLHPTGPLSSLSSSSESPSSPMVFPSFEFLPSPLQKLSHQAKSLTQSFSFSETTSKVKSKLNEWMSSMSAEKPTSPLYPTTASGWSSATHGPGEGGVTTSDPSSIAFTQFLEKMNDRRAYPLVKYYRSFIRTVIQRSWTLTDLQRVIQEFVEFMHHQFTLNEVFKPVDPIPVVTLPPPPPPPPPPPRPSQVNEAALSRDGRRRRPPSPPQSTPAVDPTEAAVPPPTRPSLKLDVSATSLLPPSSPSLIKNVVEDPPSPLQALHARCFQQYHDGLEKLVFHKLYSITFSPNTTDDAVQDDWVHHKIQLFDWISFEHLEIHHIDLEWATPYLEAAQRELCIMDHYKAPAEKLTCIMNCCKHIFDLLRSVDQTQDADQLLPLLIYVILHSNPPHIFSNAQFIQRFRHRDQLEGEPGYYLTHVLGALHFIQRIEVSSLNISKDDFEDHVNRKMQTVALLQPPPPPPSSSSSSSSSSLSVSTSPFSSGGRRVQHDEVSSSSPFPPLLPLRTVTPGEQAPDAPLLPSPFP